MKPTVEQFREWVDRELEEELGGRFAAECGTRAHLLRLVREELADPGTRATWLRRSGQPAGYQAWIADLEADDALLYRRIAERAGMTFEWFCRWWYAECLRAAGLHARADAVCWEYVCLACGERDFTPLDGRACPHCEAWHCCACAEQHAAECARRPEPARAD